MDFKIEWPEGKKFAFTIVDDPDNQTLENGKPVYDLLNDLGFKTTKLIWPIPGYKNPYRNSNAPFLHWVGDTCDNTDFLNWVKELEKNGFEIGLHNVTFHSSNRQEIVNGLNKFHEIFQRPPNIHANHMENQDNLYWYGERLSGIHKFLYNVMTLNKTKNISQGHIETSPFFWGDLCEKNIIFMRNFVFKEINTLSSCPFMPYHDSKRPYIKYWFASSNGNELNSYLHLLSETNQDKLENEGGLCIVYTHFGKGLCVRW